MKDFLRFYIAALVKFRPHRHHHSWMKEAVKLLTEWLEKFAANPKISIAMGDFSMNPRIQEAIMGTMEQFREFREFSLENFVAFFWKYAEGVGYQFQQSNLHFSCLDPKHDVHIHAAAFKVSLILVTVRFLTWMRNTFTGCGTRHRSPRINAKLSFLVSLFGKKWFSAL